MANRASFKINPANALGIDADATRSKLIALALSKPESYYKLRDTAINSITRQLATQIYDMYWDILTVGVIPPIDGEQANPAYGSENQGRRDNKWQLVFPDVNGSPYAGEDFEPNIPEKEVNIICSKISDQI